MLQRKKLMAMLLTAALVFSGNWAVTADVKAADADEVQEEAAVVQSEAEDAEEVQAEEATVAQSEAADADEAQAEEATVVQSEAVDADEAQAEEVAVVQSKAADGGLIDDISFYYNDYDGKKIYVSDNGVQATVWGALGTESETEYCVLKYKNEDNGKELELDGEYELGWGDESEETPSALCMFYKDDEESWDQYIGGYRLQQILIRKTDGSTVTYSSSANCDNWDDLVEEAYFVLSYPEDSLQIMKVEILNGKSLFSAGDSFEIGITVKNNSSETRRIDKGETYIEWQDSSSAEGDIVRGITGDNSGTVTIRPGATEVVRLTYSLNKWMTGGKKEFYMVELYDDDFSPITLMKKSNGVFECEYDYDYVGEVRDVNADINVAENENGDQTPLALQKVTVDKSKLYPVGSKVPVTVYFANEEQKKAKLSGAVLEFFVEDGGDNDYIEVDNFTKNANGSYTFYIPAAKAGIYRGSVFRFVDEAGTYSYYYDFDSELEDGTGIQDVTFKAGSLSLSALSAKGAAGKKLKVSAVFKPSTLSDTKVTWKSSNTKYASVNSRGEVTFKKAGAGKSVTITATAGGVKASKKFTVMKNAVKSIKLKAAGSVKAGKSLKVKATVKTTGSKANKTLKWTSSNTKYATVSSSGKVTAKAAGKGKSVKITATSTDGTNKKKSVTIKIK